MLIITKIEDPEELDTRFSKFSPSPEDESDDLLSSLASELLEGADGLLNRLASQGQEETVRETPPQAQPQEEKPSARIYRFDSLDGAVDAAHAAGGTFTGVNTDVYKRQVYTSLSSRRLWWATGITFIPSSQASSSCSSIQS